MNLWAFYLAVSFTLGAIALLLVLLLAWALWRTHMSVYAEVIPVIESIRANVQKIAANQSDPQAAQDKADTIGALQQLDAEVAAMASPPPQ